MNAIFLLMGLLVLSYLGGVLVGRRGSGVVGLPAGLEYVALGFVLSPTLLGLVERSMLEAFSPLVHVALGWLALIVGLDFGYAGKHRVRGRVVVAGALGAALTLALVTTVTFLLLTRFGVASAGRDRLLLAGGMGAATSETTRHAVRWVIDRYHAQGPLSELLHGYTATDDLIPLLALGALFALAPASAEASVAASDLYALLRMGLTLGLGGGLGFVALVLIGTKTDGHAVWGALLGTTLLGVGTAARLGLSEMTIAFAQGLTIAVASKQRSHLRALLGPTERAVLLPTLLLAGTRLDFAALFRSRALLVVVAAALCARVVGKLVSGVNLGGAAPGLHGSARSRLGLGLLSSGALSVGIGLVFALRFPGVVGDTVLVTSALSVVLGELISPRVVRSLLQAADELEKAPRESLPDPGEAREVGESPAEGAEEAHAP